MLCQNIFCLFIDISLNLYIISIMQNHLRKSIFIPSLFFIHLCLSTITMDKINHDNYLPISYDSCVSNHSCSINTDSIIKSVTNHSFSSLDYLLLFIFYSLSINKYSKKIYRHKQQYLINLYHQTNIILLQFKKQFLIFLYCKSYCLKFIYLYSQRLNLHHR